MMDAARTRIGRITLKSGGSVRLLRKAPNGERAYIERRVRELLDAHRDGFVGFAFMVWDGDNKSICDSGSFKGSRIPNSMIPDFVRNRLFLERGMEWSVDETLDRLGYPAPPPDPAA